MGKIHERVIRKVMKNKINEQKFVTIPKNCEIQENDYVELRKIPDLED